MNTVMRLKVNLLDLLLTSYCLLCAVTPARASGLCEECEQDLPWQAPGCIRCAELLADSSSDDYVCGRCRISPPDFDRCVAVFSYEAPIPGLISRFKDKAGFCEFRSLAYQLRRTFRQFYEDTAEPAPQLLLPVPLHAGRLRTRGYNQAGMLAASLARDCGITLISECCSRQPALRSQRESSATEREKNMSGMFKANKHTSAVRGKRVAIIDDVVTTTATSRAMASVLRQHGARTIDVWALARANP
jgi:ComF family protein